MDELTLELRSLIASKFKVPPERLRADTDLTLELGADSLDVVELIMAFEERLGVSIDDAEAEGVRTFGDLIALVRSKRAA